jgi:D-alanyl-D-alanine carboxypeptidase/D-alanyl-D-alanine-endopeptidase (penicillin-binding protein 4)
MAAPDAVAGPVFGAAGQGPVPAGLAAKLKGGLGALLDGDGLGSVRTGAVLDVATGTVLYDHHAGTATTPASTTKLATAVAALGLLGDSYTLTTRAVLAPGGRVVLVGGGDPTLEVGRLAADTAAALRARGTTHIRVGYDTSYFTGPLLHPIGPNENLAPVSALMVREGRLDGSASGPAPRSTDPAWSAAHSFAELLRSHGITVSGSLRAADGARGTQLALHHSAPLDQLVERMLTNSDNDIAEALARQVALAGGRPASFAGAARAIPAALREYGVPLGHCVFTDGSGLAHEDALSPATLTRLLALAASPAHPELRPVLDGLPIASFTGTLAARFTGEPGAGLVRAKTGTLTGTNTIAGITTTPSGRVLAFSFMLQSTQSPPAAEAALDSLASTVSRA